MRETQSLGESQVRTIVKISLLLGEKEEQGQEQMGENLLDSSGDFTNKIRTAKL